MALGWCLLLPSSSATAQRAVGGCCSTSTATALRVLSSLAGCSCSEQLLQSLRPRCPLLERGCTQLAELSVSCPTQGQVCCRVFISCSSFKKWHQQMLWIPKYSLLSVQGKVEQPEGLFASPRHPPATTWGVLQGEAALSWEARQPCFCFQADGLWWDESCGSALAGVILKLRHL